MAEKRTLGPQLRLPPELRRRMTTERFGVGALLVSQGESTDRLFMIAAGHVRVILGGGKDGRVVSRLGKGAWIGETALLTGSVSSTTVVAEEDVRALAISQHDFLAAAAENPEIFRGLARALAERLRSADDLIGSAPAQRIVALRHGRAHAPHAARILSACVRWATVPHLSVVLDGPGNSKLTVGDCVRDRTHLSTLAARVRGGDLTSIPAAGADADELSQFVRSVREFAGLVIVAGDGVPRAIAADLTDDITLTRSRAGSPSLSDSAGASALDIAIDDRFDADRAARRICGRRIGLALGGGGARGFAHVGVLRTLAAHGIPVDVVAGTSVGAAVAAGVAAGRSPDEISSSIDAAGRGALMPSLPPLNSLFSGAFVERELRRQFGSREFADLNLPLGVTAVELFSGEERLFTSGPLVPAIMASMAVPGIFSPVRIDGRVLVDGALRSPVPVRACRALGADIVIASHMRVAPPTRSTRRRALPWVPETIVGALDVMQDHIATESVGDADTRIETLIPREQAGLFDFGHRYAIEAAGERAASAASSQMNTLLPAERRAA